MTDRSGRYGILRLLSSKTKLPVTSFPVDSDVLTFGRDTTCDVRMYFTFVSPLHAKLVFEDEQAFLSVMGMQGVVVNGNVVMPSSRSGEPIILPLQDQAEFTIHNKTFKFEYPNEDTHSVWVQTPPRKSRKSLRMSMINAARVMSPGTKVSPLTPSLEVLQSPVKPYAGIGSSTERDLEVVLAEGDDVTVSKQGNDLVIVESIGNSDQDELDGARPVAKGTLHPQSEHNSPMEPPRTPVRPRTPTSGISMLHKAVLVRNSRLAMMDREDEEEVFQAVSPERNISPDEEHEEADEQDAFEDDNPFGYIVPVNDASSHEHDEDEVMDESPELEELDHEQLEEQREASRGDPMSARPSLLRASLGAIGNALVAPFSRAWSANSGELDDQPQDTDQHSDGGEGVASEEEDVTHDSSLEQSMETDEHERNTPVTDSDPEQPDYAQESYRHSTPPPSPPVPRFPSPSTRHLSPSKSRSQSLETNISEATILARRNRNSAFGLPERWIRNAAPEPEEELEGTRVNGETLIQLPPPSTPIKTSFVSSISSRPFSTPLPTLNNGQPAQTPTLDSLRKQVRKFEIDNANRASRLSFGYTPTMFRLQSPSKSHAEARQPDMDGPEFAEVAEDSRSSSSESGSESNEEPGLASPGISKAAIPATPLRDNRPSSQVPPKTPSFTGFKSLFGPPPKEAATPSFEGMRTMFNIKQLQPVPPTPNFRGIDEMFAPAKVAEIEQDIVKVTPGRGPSRAQSGTSKAAGITQSFQRIQESMETVRSSTTLNQDEEILASEVTDVATASVVESVTPTTTNTRRSSSRTRSTEPASSSSRARTRSSKHIIKDILEQSPPEERSLHPIPTRSNQLLEEATVPKRKKSPVDIGPAKSARTGRGVDLETNPIFPKAATIKGSTTRATRIPPASGRRTRASADPSPATEEPPSDAKPAGSRVSGRTKRGTPVVKEESEAEETIETAESAPSGVVSSGGPRTRSRTTPPTGETIKRTRSVAKKKSTSMTMDGVDKENAGAASGEGGEEGEEGEEVLSKAVRVTRTTLSRKAVKGVDGVVSTPSGLPQPVTRARRTRSAKK